MHPDDHELAPIPEGARLLHIGPHKTGTTALQAACWAARGSLLEQGVRYAGRSRHSARAVRAVVGRVSSYSDEPPAMGSWLRLAREIRDAREPRLLVSSEYFSLARPEIIRRILDDLAPGPVHIAITLRPLGRIMPSMWQQGLQAGGTASLDAWVRRLLATAESGKDLDAPGGRDVSFWTNHRHDRLVERWGHVVGPERVTVVVVDDRDTSVLLRAFERLLGVDDGTIRTIPAFANRSLTMPEAEAIRVFNKVLRKESPGKALQAVAVRLGAAQQLKRRQPEPDEERVQLPSWAVAEITDLAREMTATIARSGVQVVGDPDLLVEPPAGRPEGRSGRATAVAPDIAASLAMGVLIASGAARTATLGARFGDTALDVIPTHHLVAALGGRSWARLVGTVRGAGRRRPTAREVPPVSPDPALAALAGRALPLPPGSAVVLVGASSLDASDLSTAIEASATAAAALGIQIAQGQVDHGTAPAADDARRPPEAPRPHPKRVLVDAGSHEPAALIARWSTATEQGAAAVHVIVAVRRPADALRAAWERYVVAGGVMPAEDWLAGRFERDGGEGAPARVVAGWLDAAGPANVSVAILDDGKGAGRALRVAERLVGLRDGSLASHDTAHGRALTEAELEAIRVFNGKFEAAGLPAGLHRRVIADGAVAAMDAAPAGRTDGAPPLDWAAELARTQGLDLRAVITRSGVAVIGDTARLEADAGAPLGAVPGPIRVPVGASARMALGVLRATGLAERLAVSPGVLRFAEPAAVASVPSATVARIIVARGRRSATRRWRRIAGGRGPGSGRPGRG